VAILSVAEVEVMEERTAKIKTGCIKVIHYLKIKKHKEKLM
jgi:hypothetical protein